MLGSEPRLCLKTLGLYSHRASAIISVVERKPLDRRHGTRRYEKVQSYETRRGGRGRPRSDRRASVSSVKELLFYDHLNTGLAPGENEVKSFEAKQRATESR